jgi:hypothetical protein
MEREERFWLRVRPGKWWPPALLLMLLSGEVMKDVEGEMPVGEDVCGMAKKDVRRRWRESRVEVVGWEGEKGDGLVAEAILFLGGSVLEMACVEEWDSSQLFVEVEY